jgi:GntR family transcriptional regulator, transcriptional repressor for pyruvate dehydrogenase complex
VSVSAPVQPLRTLPRERLIDRAVQAIRDYILSNKLKGGDRLPPELELARSLGVSRNVIRQAISALETLGVVRAAQGRGIYVADLADTAVFSQLATWLDTSDLDDDEYFQVRAIFERGIFELLIDHASDRELEQIEGIARAMQDAADPNDVHRLHDEFHQACLAATGNRFLLTMGTILYRFLWSVAAAGPRVYQVDVPGLQSSHRRIAELLRRRRREDVPALTAWHLGRGEALVDGRRVGQQIGEN